jgi:outer membrane protein OmpA-like peptidoglycan-associated protein
MDHRDFEPENFNFWPVYSDLAIVLVLVLSLLSMGLMVLVTHLYALVPASVLDAQNQIRVAVQPLKDKGVSVCEEHGSNQTIVLSSDAVFGSGKSSIGDMKQDGLEVVKSVGEILARMRGTYQRIQIEGHASYESPDLRGPVGGDAADRYGMLNWRLSAERAGAVMQVFIKEGVPDYKISAAARGHYHPVVGSPCNLSINSEYYKQYNKTVEQREQNRRINILIMYGTEEAAK